MTDKLPNWQQEARVGHDPSLTEMVSEIYDFIFGERKFGGDPGLKQRQVDIERVAKDHEIRIVGLEVVNATNQQKTITTGTAILIDLVKLAAAGLLGALSVKGIH